MSLRIKICGMRDPENVREVAGLRPDMMGFIFYPGSKRFVSDDFVMPEMQNVLKVGVFVNSGEQSIRELIRRHGLDMIQLHGDESPDFCSKFREDVKVIKAIGVRDRADVIQAKAYFGTVDHFLFDNQTPDHGGSGKQFDHTLLEAYEGQETFILSGGLGLKEIRFYRQFYSDPRLYALDLNSRFETAPAMKDVSLLKDALA